MNCKFCNGELPEDVTLCPACGKENLDEVTEETAEETVAEVTEETAEEIVEETAEETVAEVTEETAEEIVEETAEEAVAGATEETAEEAEEPAEPAKKKTKVWKIVLATIGAIALVAVLACAVMYGMGVFEKNVAAASYTVDEAEAIKARDVVVATVGTEELTNSELQVFYWQTINEFYNYYGYYMDMESLGLDLDKPLDEQYYSEEEGITWQQYFVESALSTWSRYAALCMLGKEAGFELEEEAVAYIDSIPQQMEELAVSYGYESAADLLKADMSPACDIEGYTQFLRTNLYAGQYMETLEDSLVPTDAEIEAYYEANTEDLNAQGVVKDGSVNVDVRHILICPKGGTEDENGNVAYTEADWEACRQEAQRLYDEWLKDGTEEGFAEMAAEYTEDPGSMSSGGLYTDVYEGQMVTAFNDWCFDASRKYGDSGLVQTNYGYHIMFFVASRDVWLTNMTNIIVNERSTELVDGAAEKWPMEANYKKIVIGQTAPAEE